MRRGLVHIVCTCTGFYGIPVSPCTLLLIYYIHLNRSFSIVSEGVTVSYNICANSVYMPLLSVGGALGIR